ncbi:hypothetical protein T11_11255 [Trichinella zimbabwensis]|uniref:Integrase zinc-binding domain-containing protein n=1 Tax=Trichinella zimbabwensis TaxID=268475 RepID=A0A0V1I9B5_9BILA|nr:hypothetical protein T11_11255 [Trichinella zimbabwensis]
MAADGAAALKKFEEALCLDGRRYQVSLPWIPGRPELPNNCPQAKRRLLTLDRRLNAREEDRAHYSSVMRQYFDEDWAEPAPAASPSRRTWYLPHQAVYQGSGDELKCRVMFDGTARYDGTTLNSQLEAVPNLQIDLLRAILRFRLYLDEAGTLRVEGRLEKSDLSLSERHPAILPSEHEITRGLIRRCHLRQLHAGVSQILATLRQRYWIPQGVVAMAALPEDRTTPAPAFTHVGMDFTGPVFVRVTNKGTAPRYVSDHVHGLPSSTLGARPGDVDGRSVEGSLTLYGPAVQTGDHSERQLPLFPERRCGGRSTWIRSREIWPGKGSSGSLSPQERHGWGGYWERLLHSTKGSLRKVLGQALLDDEELRTFLCEVAACLNTRPLTLVEEVPDEFVPLSPFQLLTGRTYADLPAERNGADRVGLITEVRG